MGRYTRMLCIFAAIVLLLAACGGDEGAGNDTGTGTGTEESPGSRDPLAEETPLTSGDIASFHGQEDVSGEETQAFELDDNYFEPTVLIGRPGQEITLEMFNVGGNIHNFSLTEQNIDEDFPEGAEREVQVTFPDSGTLQFFCKYHAEFGMRGELGVGGNQS